MILADNDEINAYRRLVRDTMRSRTFSQNKAQFEGIITNLLDLLARLNSKGVAIRDLKPDNLFVVGEPARPMSLLANSAEYSIGLIDFETAVEYGKTDNKKRIPQPLLAGTPAYATPANLFPNRVLQSLFSDLSHTLHLQDWFAVVGMCYRVITGETLFRDTGQILPGLVREIKRFSKDKKRLAALFREKSLRFWISAIREYDEKKEQSAFLITSVYPRITKPAAELLKKELMKEYRRCGEGIREKIGTQGWFKSEKSRKDLLRLSSAGLKRVRENWEKGIGVPKLSIEIRKRIIRFFRDLEAAKTAGEDVSDKIRRLGSPDPRLTTMELMDLMFDVVRKNMHPDAWEDVAAKARMSPDPTKEPEKAADIEVTDEQTASIEKTLSAGKSKDTDKSRRDG
jgi:serine/threonine protein kinase